MNIAVEHTILDIENSKRIDLFNLSDDCKKAIMEYIRVGGKADSRAIVHSGAEYLPYNGNSSLHYTNKVKALVGELKSFCEVSNLKLKEYTTSSYGFRHFWIEVVRN